ncbi:hypothetical protein AK812_SmicGene41272 [Symbiodinium microadriaticum]|uniref:Uncharacterized protein n=1 Tax=Symbiodinium microadriaticum TaxID=2951 RepID=A0A1Q9C6J0_SYMMI|nr:hypothetical protein AK812_SmicGene41272 [Symbiodinium microadriaticum]
MASSKMSIIQEKVGEPPMEEDHDDIVIIEKRLEGAMEELTTKEPPMGKAKAGGLIQPITGTTIIEHIKAGSIDPTGTIDGIPTGSIHGIAGSIIGHPTIGHPESIRHAYLQNDSHGIVPLQPPVAMAEDRHSEATGPASTAPSSPTSGHTVVDAYWMEASMEPSVESISSDELEPCEEMLHMAREDARAKAAAIMPKPGPIHGMTGPPISSIYFQMDPKLPPILVPMQPAPPIPMGTAHALVPVLPYGPMPSSALPRSSPVVATPAPMPYPFCTPPPLPFKGPPPAPATPACSTAWPTACRAPP